MRWKRGGKGEREGEEVCVRERAREEEEERGTGTEGERGVERKQHSCKR